MPQIVTEPLVIEFCERIGVGVYQRFEFFGDRVGGEMLAVSFDKKDHRDQKEQTLARADCLVFVHLEEQPIGPAE